MRILIIDDSDSVRAMVRVTLEDSTHTIVEAANGAAAIQLLVNDRGPVPSLIILNLEMPTMSGWEFARIVKSYHRLASIPILVTSAHGPEALPDVVIAGYIRKPFGAAELRAAVALASPSQTQ
jgi:two-component system, OmpR family, KDP operon response regulator KdpE